MHERHQQYLEQLSARAGDAVERYDLKGVRAEVVLVLDVSKSMYAMYKSNMVSELATRLLALSLEFDDDGVIPAYAFGDTCRHLADLTVKDFPGWVEREVIRTGNDFQSACNYAPAIHEVCSYFFPEDWHEPTRVTKTGLFRKTTTVYPTLSIPRVHPVYALFVTSGDCDDQEATTDAVRRSSRLPIFWQFIGLQSGKGPATRFSFLEKLDKLGNTYVDNCGFFEASDLRNDKLLFEGMCSEFPMYLRLPQVAEMLDPMGRSTKGERNVDGQVQQTKDTATRMPAFEPEEDEGAPSLDFDRNTQMRRAAVERAQSRREHRAQSEESRIIAAASDAPAAKAPASAAKAPATAAKAPAPGVAKAPTAAPGAKTPARPGAAAPPPAAAPSAEAPLPSPTRERRIRLDTQQRQRLADAIDAPPPPPKTTERTVIRMAADDSDERAAAQEASTRMVTARADEQDDEAPTPSDRLAEIRARRAARDPQRPRT